MAITKMYVGDEGTRITLDAGADLSATTTRKIKYFKPDGSGSGEWTAVLDTGNTNRIYYDTLENDLNVAGLWYFQLYVEMPGWSGHGEMISQQIETPIEVTA